MLENSSRALVRRRTVSLLVALGVSTGCSTTDLAPDPVVLDGSFNDWSTARTIVSDASDAAGAAIDVRSVLGIDEPAWLYLSLDLGREVNVQAMRGTLSLLLDTDDEVSTGTDVHGMSGVDLVLQLSQRTRPQSGGYGAGFSLGTGGQAGEPGSAYALGITVAPTWAASRFEVRISRRGGAGLDPFGRSLRLKAVFEDDVGVRDETAIGAYVFTTVLGEPDREPVRPRLRKPRDAIRVSQWNVASGSFGENAAGFARVLGALEPDVILLDEVYGDVTDEALTAFFRMAPLSALGAWSFTLGESGGRQKTVVGARGRAIRPAESMQRVVYPGGAIDALRELGSGTFERLLDLEAERHVAATGAWVDVGDREALFVALDLQSAGWAGSPNDALRLLQARTIRAHVKAEIGDATAPVVIGGDLNLVGSREPLEALIEGLDVDGSSLSPVDALRLGERTFSTWRNAARGLFAPGRLDFLLVPDATVDVLNSFVFDTDDLDALTLRELGLERELSESLSDHLVVTADLRFR